MIYVEEKDFNRQIELLSYLANSHDANICAWLYPESKVRELAGHEVTSNPSSLTPATEYEDGHKPRCTAPTAASSAAINSFAGSHAALKKNCDSLALYKINESSWLAVTIGHEGMCLIQDNSLLNSLIKAGYAASTDAPDWW
jgi:hypothetical protein